MAHLWEFSDDGEWQALPLGGDLLVLRPDGPPRPLPALDADACRSDVLVRRAEGPGVDGWLLLAGGDVRTVLVNGVPVDHGIAALTDRDEIRVPGSVPVFFSTERLAEVAPYPADAPRGYCPRCKLPIDAGDASVRCPGCGLYYHASEKLPCWTYDERCASCGHPTALDAGFQWTPEDL